MAKLPVWGWIVIAVVALAAIGGAVGDDTDDESSAPPTTDVPDGDPDLGDDEEASPTSDDAVPPDDDPPDDDPPDDDTTVVSEPEPTAATTAAPTTTEQPTTTSTSTTTTTTTSTTSSTTTTTLPPFEPLVFSGQGSDVITLASPIDEPLLARTSHDGASNFIVTLLDADGDRADGLVNEIGVYTGTHAVNFDGRSGFTFIEVDADGAWEIVFDEITTATEVDTSPGAEFQGQGSDVVLFRIDGPTPIDIECANCESNFIVTAWGDSRRGLVNEIGAYTGRVLVPADTLLLEVHAGPGFDSNTNPEWRITVG